MQVFGEWRSFTRHDGSFSHKRATLHARPEKFRTVGAPMISALPVRGDLDHHWAVRRRGLSLSANRCGLGPGPAAGCRTWMHPKGRLDTLHRGVKLHWRLHRLSGVCITESMTPWPYGGLGGPWMFVKLRSDLIRVAFLIGRHLHPRMSKRF
jgi:hypothetical protein